MKKILFIILVTFNAINCTQPQPTAKQEAKPKIEFSVNPDEILSLRYDDELMRAAKAAYDAKDPEFMSLFAAFQKATEARYMDIQPRSLVEGIKFIPPSGDPRDYITLSGYWWPDPDSPDGMPYIRNDGVRNPETQDYPGARYIGSMTNGAENLAFLYFITGDEKYAAKATELIRVWFLDPETGMNTNIVFSQYVPGMARIRGTGLTATNNVSAALNAAKMMEKSSSWTDDYEAQMQDWATAYLYWMEYSTHGQEEGRGANNHATWYEVNRETLSLYIKDYEHLAEIIYSGQYPRLSNQVGPDSTLPNEMTRTVSLYYMAHTLNSLSSTFVIANKIGITDMWNHIGPNGRGVLWPLDFVIPYWFAPETWPYPQSPAIAPINSSTIIPGILYQAYKGTGNQRYLDLAKEIGLDPKTNFETSPNITSLLYYKFKK